VKPDVRNPVCTPRVADESAMGERRWGVGKMVGNPEGILFESFQVLFRKKAAVRAPSSVSREF